MNMFRRGSVIVDLIIDYNFINREQLVQIVDSMEETEMFGTVALGYFSVNTSKSKNTCYLVSLQLLYIFAFIIPSSPVLMVLISLDLRRAPS